MKSRVLVRLSIIWDLEGASESNYGLIVRFKSDNPFILSLASTSQCQEHPPQGGLELQ